MKWRLATAVGLGVLIASASPALASALSTGAVVYDANKAVFPVAANDLSCWIASAANMLAADEWDAGNVTDIYNQLKANPAFQNGTGWRGGFQSQALQYAIDNFGPTQGLKLNMSGYDNTESIEVYNYWRVQWNAGEDQKTLLNKLLNQPTSPTEDGIFPNPLDDDPVGIAFHYDGPGQPIAHAVTAWGMRTFNGVDQLGITDSDDGPAAPVQYFDWVGNTSISYYGRVVLIDYMAALRDPDDPLDPLLDTPRGFVDQNVGAPDLPTPEPGSLILLGTGLLAFARFGRRWAKS